MCLSKASATNVKYVIFLVKSQRPLAVGKSPAEVGFIYRHFLSQLAFFSATSMRNNVPCCRRVALLMNLTRLQPYRRSPLAAPVRSKTTPLARRRRDHPSDEVSLSSEEAREQPVLQTWVNLISFSAVMST